MRTLWALASLPLLGCAPPPTEVVIELHGDSRIEGATVDIVAIGPDGPRALPRQTIDAADLPIELPIVPLGGDATRWFVVEVTVGVADSAPITLRLRGRYEPDTLVRAPVWLVAPPLCDDAIDETCMVRPRSPANGAHTGSVHAAASLAPTFSWDEISGAERYELENRRHLHGRFARALPFCDARAATDHDDNARHAGRTSSGLANAARREALRLACPRVRRRYV